MKRAWISQKKREVERLGCDQASYFVGWYDASGRQRVRSCGPGEAGRQAAEKLKAEVEAGDLAESCFELRRPLRPVSHAVRSDLINQLAGVRLVYFIEADGMERVKIGFTNDLPRRLEKLQCASPCRLRLLTYIRAGRNTERTLHRTFASCRLHGEWFQMTRSLCRTIRRYKDLESRKY